MWNPETPTQFFVANDDDKNPSINLWDLRQPSYPLATYGDIHQAGILSFSWCLSDPSLVVSSGKDGRTVVTNFKTSETVLEFPTDQAFKGLRWSTQMPGKLCAMSDSSDGGSTSVLSFEPEGLLSNPGRPFATPAVSRQTQRPYVPAWTRPKRCGARFGFGNKLLTFDESQSSLVVHHRPSDADLGQRVQEFVDQISGQTDLVQLCEEKSK